MTPEERYAAIDARLDRVARMQEEMTARQQYHDEAFERMDARSRKTDEQIDKILAAIRIDAANIRRLAGISQERAERLDALDGGNSENS